MHSRSSFSLPATTFGVRSAARRRWIHDLHDPGAAGKLRADRASRRTAGLHTVQCGGAFGRSRKRRTALRLPPAEASLLRQIHDGGGPLGSHVLRAVDDHGPGAVSQVSADRRSALSRRPEGRDAAGRRLGIPAQPGRAEDAATRNRVGRSSAVRASERPRHSCARWDMPKAPT